MSAETMTVAEMDQLIERHYAAEERSDAHGAARDLAEDVEHELAGVHMSHSKEQARLFYEDLFAKLTLRRIVSRRRLYGDGFAVDEALVESETAAGESGSFRLLHVFEFKAGRIVRESAWQAPLDDESL